MMNETRVELSEADKLRNITDKFGCRPRFEKVVLRFRRPVTIGTNINPDEFETSWEEVAFEKVEG